MTARPRIAFLTVQLEFDGTYPDLIVQEALRSAERRGCDLLVVPGREWGADLDHEGIFAAVYRLLPTWPLDAVILAPPVTNHWAEDDLKRGIASLSPLPVVSIGIPIGSTPQVELDSYQGVHLLVSHLIHVHGRRRIACLRGPHLHAAAEVRYQAWKNALDESGVGADPLWCAEVEFKEEGVAEALSELLERVGPIDALVAASDLVALAAIRELRRRGLRVPEDVSVVGFDDLPLSATADPSLTTVNQDLASQVDQAFALAVEQLRNPAAQPQALVRSRVIYRRSCGCAEPHEVPPAGVEGVPGGLTRRLERLATFNLGLGYRQSEAEFHQWLGDQFRHQGFPEAILALVPPLDGVPGHHGSNVDPRSDIPLPPQEWVFPFPGRDFRSLWTTDRASRVALPLASRSDWFGLMILRLDADGALIYRGLQEGLTRRYRDLWERQMLVSQRVEQEIAKRVEQEKIRSLGDLVAGVAHEVNTPLGNAITAASYLETLLATARNGGERDEESVIEASGLLRQNLDRAADLVSRFKRISVDLIHDPQELTDLSAFLTDLLPSISFPLRRAGIDLESDLPSGLWATTSTTALFDILTNLMQNVLDHAYPEGGPGVVRLKLQGSSGGKGAVVLVFEDEGRGMREDDRRRVFEPFFTTRRARGGTGLGLHIVFNLVTQRLGGIITCESSWGKGSRFRIELPNPEGQTQAPPVA